MRIRYDLSNTYAPPVDYWLPCKCQACELGILLWHTEEENHPVEWQAFWNTLAAQLASDKGQSLIQEELACWRQLRAWGMAMSGRNIDSDDRADETDRPIRSL